METLDYWTPADALAFRCPPDKVGQLRPAPDAVALAGERPDQTAARLYADRAMRNLARLSEGEGKVALEAARTILERAYGPALGPAPQAVNTPEPQGADPRALPPPTWLDTEGRHSYKALDS
jgi:hypothetical protein